MSLIDSEYIEPFLASLVTWYNLLSIPGMVIPQLLGSISELEKVLPPKYVKFMHICAVLAKFPLKKAANRAIFFPHFYLQTKGNTKFF